MAKQNDSLKIMDQIIKRMDEHNLAEAKVGNIHLKKENPQVIAEREQGKEIDEKSRQNMSRIPDWLILEVASEDWTPDDELVKVNDQVMRRRQYKALQDAQNPPEVNNPIGENDSRRNQSVQKNHKARRSKA